jgi:hypothetical protein
MYQSMRKTTDGREPIKEDFSYDGVLDSVSQNEVLPRPINKSWRVGLKYCLSGDESKIYLSEYVDNIQLLHELSYPGLDILRSSEVKSFDQLQVSEDAKYLYLKLDSEGS